MLTQKLFLVLSMILHATQQKVLADKIIILYLCFVIGLKIRHLTTLTKKNKWFLLKAYLTEIVFTFDPNYQKHIQSFKHLPTFLSINVLTAALR